MNYAEWYKKASKPFRTCARVKAIRVLDLGLVAIIAAAYVIALVSLVASWDTRFFKALLVPASAFAFVTILRKFLDNPRPYEIYDIEPIIEKSTTGKSLPSRHLASAVIIAFALVWLDPRMALPAFASCAIVAFTRIVGGVHFPRDILASIAISLVFGIVGFIAIP